MNLRLFFQKPHVYVFLIFLGVGLEFYDLESRLFWVDEVYSILYTGGGVKKEIAPVNEVNTLLTMTACCI